MTLVVGIDIGSSSVRTIAFNLNGEIVEEGRYSIKTEYTLEGFALQEPDNWVEAVLKSMKALSERLGEKVKNIAGIGLTGHCPSFALVYPDGTVSKNAIIYQDVRGVLEIKHMIDCYGIQKITKTTGMYPTHFYIAPKLMWLNLHNREVLKSDTLIMQPRDYINFKLTGIAATDTTHAACTLLYDISLNEWKNDWLKDLSLSHIKFPQVLNPTEKVGELKDDIALATGMPKGIPVIIGGADSICAAIGADALNQGTLCDVSGTTTCLHMSNSFDIVTPLINSYPLFYPGDFRMLESGLNTTGAAINWISNIVSTDIDLLAKEAISIPPGSDGLMFIPHLSGGERDNSLRQGGFIGLQLKHTKAHMFRAVLEGISYAIKLRLESFKSAGVSVKNIKICGGGARLSIHNQIKADVCGINVASITPHDTTSLGAAVCAAKGVGLNINFKGLNETVYTPDVNHHTIYTENIQKFKHMEDNLS